MIANLYFNKYIEGLIKRKMLIKMAAKNVRHLGTDLTEVAQAVYRKKNHKTSGKNIRKI